MSLVFIFPLLGVAACAIHGILPFFSKWFYVELIGLDQVLLGSLVYFLFFYCFSFVFIRFYSACYRIGFGLNQLHTSCHWFFFVGVSQRHGRRWGWWCHWFIGRATSSRASFIGFDLWGGSGQRKMPCISGACEGAATQAVRYLLFAANCSNRVLEKLPPIKPAEVGRGYRLGELVLFQPKCSSKKWRLQVEMRLRRTDGFFQWWFETTLRQVVSKIKTIQHWRTSIARDQFASPLWLWLKFFCDLVNAFVALKLWLFTNTWNLSKVLHQNTMQTPGSAYRYR